MVFRQNATARHSTAQRSIGFMTLRLREQGSDNLNMPRAVALTRVLVKSALKKGRSQTSGAQELFHHHVGLQDPL
jgi:hypothetical protein